MHASHSFKTLPRKLMSIEEYLATKGLANRSAKPVLTLVPSPTPSMASARPPRPRPTLANGFRSARRMTRRTTPTGVASMVARSATRGVSPTVTRRTCVA